MNKKAMLVIFIGLNLLALMIDPVLAGIFLLMWPMWYKYNFDRLDP